MRFFGRAFTAYTDPEDRGSNGAKYDLWRARWPMVLPLYNIRECPQCGALCMGDKAVYRHRTDHFASDKDARELYEWQMQITESLRAICDKLGIGYAIAERNDDDNDDVIESEPDGYIV